MNEMTAGSKGGPMAGRRMVDIAAVAIAGVAQLVVLVPFTISSGLAAPLWAIVLLVLVWAAFTYLLVRLARRRPLLTLLVPVANFGVWWLAITAGERLLGWTA